MPQPELGARRRSIRLPGYDYSQPGAYFVTICVRDRRCVLGDIVDGKIHMNPLGRTVDETWRWLARRYTHLDLDQWVVMPNHLHGIIILTNDCRGGSRTAPTMIKRKPLGQLIGAFKTVSTKRINKMRGTPGARMWQRNYYEHIIRNDDELDQIRQYIIDNPSRWALDRENPDRAEPPAGPPS